MLYKQMLPRLGNSLDWICRLHTVCGRSLILKKMCIPFLPEWCHEEFLKYRPSSTKIWYGTPRNMDEESFQMIKKITSKVFVTDTKKYNQICVHIRLGDVPFCEYYNYKLYTIEWYKKAIEMAHAATGCTHVHMLFSTYRVPDYFRNVLYAIIDAYKPLANTYSIDEPMQDDFNRMVNSKALISTCSTFAFYAGIASRHTWICDPDPGGKYNSSMFHPLRHNMMYIDNSYRYTINHEDAHGYHNPSHITMLLHRRINGSV